MLAQGVEKFGFDPKLLHLGAGLGLPRFRVTDKIIYLTLIKDLHYNVGARPTNFCT